jgi:hypothetical protein
MDSGPTEIDHLPLYVQVMRQTEFSNQQKAFETAKQTCSASKPYDEMDYK